VLGLPLDGDAGDYQDSEQTGVIGGAP